jgi:hypothetical protein
MCRRSDTRRVPKPTCPSRPSYPQCAGPDSGHSRKEPCRPSHTSEAALPACHHLAETVARQDPSRRSVSRGLVRDFSLFASFFRSRTLAGRSLISYGGRAPSTERD